MKNKFIIYCILLIVFITYIFAISHVFGQSEVDTSNFNDPEFLANQINENPALANSATDRQLIDALEHDKSIASKLSGDNLGRALENSLDRGDTSLMDDPNVMNAIYDNLPSSGAPTILNDNPNLRKEFLKRKWGIEDNTYATTQVNSIGGISNYEKDPNNPNRDIITIKSFPKDNTAELGFVKSIEGDGSIFLKNEVTEINVRSGTTSQISIDGEDPVYLFSGSRDISLGEIPGNLPEGTGKVKIIVVSENGFTKVSIGEKTGKKTITIIPGQTLEFTFESKGDKSISEISQVPITPESTTILTTPNVIITINNIESPEDPPIFGLRGEISNLDFPGVEEVGSFSRPTGQGYDLSLEYTDYQSPETRITKEKIPNDPLSSIVNFNDEFVGFERTEKGWLEKQLDLAIRLPGRLFSLPFLVLGFGPIEDTNNPDRTVRIIREMPDR